MNKQGILTRRSFVKRFLHLAAGIGLLGPMDGYASLIKQPLSFYHTHTGERLNIQYSLTGWKPSTLSTLNTFLRDFRTGDVHPIDPMLLDILYGIRRKTGSRGVVEIISGYRSPKTNTMLRSKNTGVARKSMHMQGQALDIRLTDLKTGKLRDAAVSLRRGGVGYYAKSDFVHIDTGRFRTW